ncbi:MAG: sigma-70 family RNA polymerase sigma factor [Actinomycetota bacterium]|nr:sigma-70 family RNA polymerase sigma factor [Actinomycetota bacterium]
MSADRPDRPPPARARTTDDEYSAVVRDRYVGLARLAYALCGDRAHAEDAVAEACSRVYVHWARGKVDDLPAYLRQAVVNEVRKRHRRRALERREEERRRVDPRAHDRVDAQLGNRTVLWDALRHLSLDQRAVVVLRVVEDQSEAETAELLGIRPGTVKSRLSRALATLRDHLGATDV